MEERPSIGWMGGLTPAVRALLLANAAVFGVQTFLLIAGSLAGHEARWRAVFDDFFGLSAPDIRHGYVWQIGTYMFLHSLNPWHILFNLLTLWMFGRDVEEHLGSQRFVRLYLLGGLVGGACWLAFNWTTGRSVVGASAAVCAVLIAFATLSPDRPISLLFPPVTLKARWLAWIWVGLEAYSSLVSAGGQIASIAHLGGMAVGYLYVKWLGWGQPSWTVEKLQALARPLSRLPQRKPKPDDLPPDEYISQQVDPILDKIAREGIHSLTRRERKILEDARAKMNQRPRR